MFTGNNGLILQLKEGGGGGHVLRYFNVSFISCYGSEDERLFFGGYKPLQISTIHLLKDKLDLKPLIHSLFVLNSIVKGEGFSGDKVLEQDVAIYNKLVLANSPFPSYINDIFNSFRNKKERIKINMQYMYVDYYLFISHFISS